MCAPMQRFVHIAAGHHSAAVVDKVGNLYTWGSNGSGRLGLGHRGGTGTPTCVESLETIAVRHVSMGRNHTAAIAAGSDALYMWGCASLGGCLVAI